MSYYNIENFSDDYYNAKELIKRLKKDREPYVFTVTAVNSVGPSSSSDPTSDVLPNTIPGAPTNVTATSNETSQSTVSFTPPTDNGGSPITSYTITATSNETPSKTIVSTATIDSSGKINISTGNITSTATISSTGVITFTFPNLTNGVSYTFSVTATNSIGTSPSSTLSSIITTGVAPNAPTNGVPTALPDGTISVKFDASTIGTAPITYTVKATPGDGNPTVTASGPSSPIIMTGLKPKSTYSFYITASNLSGTSSVHQVSKMATCNIAPNSPTNVVATPGDKMASITFSAPVSNGGTDVTKYTVISNPGNIITEGTGTTIRVNGLTNDTSYTFSVKATNLIGESALSAPSSPITPTPVLTSVTASIGPFENNLGTANVNFNVSSNAASGYTYRVGVFLTPLSPTSTITGSGTSYKVTGLNLGLTYPFMVFASNPLFPDQVYYSNEITIPNVPLSPSGLTASSDKNSINLSFKVPDDKGAGISSYKIRGYYTDNTGNIIYEDLPDVTTGVSFKKDDINTVKLYTKNRQIYNKTPILASDFTNSKKSSLTTLSSTVPPETYNRVPLINYPVGNERKNSYKWWYLILLLVSFVFFMLYLNKIKNSIKKSKN